MSFKLSATSLERIRDHVQHKRDEALRHDVSELHPADVAEVITDLPEDRREALLEDFSPKELAEEVIEQLDTDDAADVIAELPEDVQQEVLANIDDSELKSELTELLTYDENTAGGLMQK